MPVYRTVIHRADIPSQHRNRLAALGRLENRPGYLLLQHRSPLDLESLRPELGYDINTLPSGFDPGRVRLMVTDLDSTLISIETIDEIAAVLGLRERVAAITARAMAGELDFDAALKERVALLEGLPAAVLEQVFEERMKPSLQPGAATTLAWFKKHGITTALVSGGFTFFTGRLQKILPIDYTRACILEIEGGRLTGKLQGTIVNGHAKAEFLAHLARRLGISPDQAIAVGDGANDVLMLEQAGLGVAYHGHAIARSHADVQINHGDWRVLRHFLLGFE